MQGEDLSPPRVNFFMFMSLLRIYLSRKRRNYARTISAYKPMNKRVYLFWVYVRGL